MNGGELVILCLGNSEEKSRAESWQQTWNEWTRQEGERASEGWSRKYIRGKHLHTNLHTDVYFLINMNILILKKFLFWGRV